MAKMINSQVVKRYPAARHDPLVHESGARLQSHCERARQLELMHRQPAQVGDADVAVVNQLVEVDPERRGAGRPPLLSAKPGGVGDADYRTSWPMNKIATLAEARIGAPTSAIDMPDIVVSAREMFGVDSDMDVPAFSVQYHPEASPGPRDSHYLFKRFADLMRAKKSA